MKTVTFSNTEILVLKEYLNCNPCETKVICKVSKDDCNAKDNNGKYICPFMNITKSIVDKLGLNTDVSV